MLVGALAFFACASVQAARSVSVDSVSNNVVKLTFGESDGNGYKLAVARGACDAGDTRANWDAIEIIGDVAPDQNEKSWTIPQGDYRYARFFLFDTNLPFANCLTMVRSNQVRGGKYLDVGVTAATPVKADLDMSMVTKNNDTEFLGAYGGSVGRFYLAHMNNDKLGQVFGGSFYYPTKNFSGYVGNHRCTSFITEAKNGACGIYVNSTTPFETQNKGTMSAGKNLWLFGCNGVSDTSSDLAVVRCKIWQGDGNELKRDFIPVKKADGKGALFDLVSRQIFSLSGGDFLNGSVVETPVEVYQTAASSATVEIRPLGALVAKRDFLNDPSATVDSLTLPTDAEAPRTVVVRFKAPAVGADTVRPVLQLKAGDTVVKSYSLDAANTLGAQTVAADVWHTLTVVGGPTRLDCYLDETQLVETSSVNGLATLGAVTGLVFGDGNAATDDNLQFAYAEVWSVAGVGEGRLAAGTRAGLVGEWTFPQDNLLRAAKGHDLIKMNMYYPYNFTCSQSTDDGVVTGDAKVYVGQYNGFRCRHGLATSSDYTAVVDVRVPSTSAAGVFQADTFAAQHAGLYLRKNTTSGMLEACIGNPGSTFTATTAANDQWCRAVVTCAGGTETVYVNGQMIVSGAYAQSTLNGPYCYFGLGYRGNDNAIDISYAAIYDRVLTAAEVAEFHGRPMAHESPSGEVLIVPERVGMWERKLGALVSCVEGAPALTVQSDGSYALTQTTAPAGMTAVFDIKPLASHLAQGGVLVANANGVATGVYGTAGNLSGCLATTTDPAIFAAGTGDTGTAAWGGCTYEQLRCGMEQRVVVTWDRLGHVRYYVNGQLISQQNPTAAGTAAQPTATMSFLKGLGSRVSRLVVYNDALTPDEVASLGGFEMVPPVPGTFILMR